MRILEVASTFDLQQLEQALGIVDNNGFVVEAVN